MRFKELKNKLASLSQVCLINHSGLNAFPLLINNTLYIIHLFSTSNLSRISFTANKPICHD